MQKKIKNKTIKQISKLLKTSEKNLVKVDDFRKLINVIVIIASGLIATIGYEVIPFKAYVIVAAVSGLLLAMIITKFKGSNNG